MAKRKAEKNKPQTNADWIRSMSDEALAAHLEDWQDWGGGLSKEMWLEWLREPVARGHWVRVEEGYTCSACGCFLDGYYIGEEDLADYKRCPKCEAPMDNE